VRESAALRERNLVRVGAAVVAVAAAGEGDGGLGKVDSEDGVPGGG
jgi:hypothetical protein